MRLRDLAGASAVSTASIKYYIHVGILPPGQKRNATTAVYGEAHLHRLALIGWLRRELDTPIEAIARLCSFIDDQSLPTIELMGECQRLALRSTAGIGGSLVVSDDVGTTESDSAEAEPPRRDFDAIVLDALTELELPDISPTARASVAAALAALSAVGYEVGRETVLTHLHALETIARTNTAPISDELSRDEICLQVIRGVTLHNRLLLSASALVHASISAAARIGPGD
ncbi:MAG: MerR family transcriptional regulator [Brevibacterium sp.]